MLRKTQYHHCKPAIAQVGRAMVSCLVLLALCGKVRGEILVLALTGQIAPGTGNARFASLAQANVGGSVEVVFAAGLTGGSAQEAIFKLSETGLNPIVLYGQPVDGLPGRTFGQFGDPSINGSGDVAFKSLLRGGATYLQAIFVKSGQVLRKLVDTETVAPGGTSGC